jgi:hypothetical protein
VQVGCSVGDYPDAVALLPEETEVADELVMGHVPFPDGIAKVFGGSGDRRIIIMSLGKERGFGTMSGEAA